METDAEPGTKKLIPALALPFAYSPLPLYDQLVEPDIEPAHYAVPGPRVALIAARLGRTRLIDNLEFELP